MNEDVKSTGVHIHSRADELIACLEGEIAKRDARIDTLTEWYANALNVISECSEALPGVTYMDQPDGGSVSVQEQVRRMRQDRDQLRAELAAIKAQEPVAFVHPEQLKGLPAESSATCAVWNKPGAMPSGTSLRVPLYAAPVAKPQVVMPDLELQAAADEAFRALEKAGDRIPDAREYMAARDGFREGAAWQARLNASPVQQVSVPDGWKLELGFDVLDKPFRFVDSKSHVPTIKFILPACEVDDTAAWDLRDKFARSITTMLAAAPAAPAADAGHVFYGMDGNHP